MSSVAGIHAAGGRGVREVAPGRGARGPALAAAFALAFAAGLAFHRVHGLSTVAPVVAVAAAGATVVAGLVSVRRPDDSFAPLWRSLVAMLAAWAAAGWGMLYRDDSPGVGLARQTFRDLLDAPHRVLTTIAPVPPEGALLVLPFTIIWLAAWAGAELALRTRTVLLPAVPALAALAVAVLLGAGGPGSNVPAAGLFAGAVGLLLALRALGQAGAAGLAVAGGGVGGSGQMGAAGVAVAGGGFGGAGQVGVTRAVAGGRGARAAVGALALAVGCALCAAVFAPAVTRVADRTPVSLRDEAAAPEPGFVAGGNPLDMVAAWLADPERPLFHVKVTAADAADAATLADHDWRLAVFTRYDGKTWLPVPELRPTGGRIPDDPARGAATSGDGYRTLPLDQQVTVQQLGGVWIPAAERAVRIDGTVTPDALAVDPDSGAVATKVPLRDGDTYRVASRVPVLDPKRVQYAGTAGDPAMTKLPDSPTRDKLRELAQKATAGAGFPYQQALRLAQWLRDNHTFDTAAVPGHTYRALDFFLSTTKRGTSEQFATAFAAMARSIGLPTRLVVGFHHGTPDGDGVQVSGRDAVVWPEVAFDGVGWVPFQPTPGDRADTGPAPAAPPPVEPAPTGPPPGAAAQRLAEDQAIIDARRDTPPTPESNPPDDSTALPWWVWPPAAVLVGALACAARGAQRAWALRRRHRAARHTADPARRIVAAWHHVGAQLQRLGMPDPATLTAEEVAAYGLAHLATTDPPARRGSLCPANDDTTPKVTPPFPEERPPPEATFEHPTNDRTYQRGTPSTPSAGHQPEPALPPPANDSAHRGDTPPASPTGAPFEHRIEPRPDTGNAPSRHAAEAALHPPAHDGSSRGDTGSASSAGHVIGAAFQRPIEDWPYADNTSALPAAAHSLNAEPSTPAALGTPGSPAEALPALAAMVNAIVYGDLVPNDTDARAAWAQADAIAHAVRTARRAAEPGTPQRRPSPNCLTSGTP